MDEKDLQQIEQLKRTLKSLVVSSACQMDVRTLTRDYREMMGSGIPFFKFGYNDLTQMLRERFNDCFKFSGPENNPFLTPIVDDSIKHIDNLVTRQKNDNTKRKGKRTSIQQYPPRNYERKNTNDSATTYNRTSNHAAYQKKTTDSITPTALITQKQSARSTPYLIDDNVGTHDTGKWVITKRKEKTPPKAPDSIAVTDSSSSTKDITGRSESAISRREKIRNELQELIEDHPNGIWSIDLQTQYKAKYDRNLDYLKLGYDSIMSLCYDLDVFSIKRPQTYGDWLLKDIRRPESPKKNKMFSIINTTRKNDYTNDNYNEEDALPGIDYEPSIFPADCLGFLESIAQVDLSHIEVGSRLEVCVAEVSDPSHFWFQVQGPEYSVPLDILMDGLLEYYSKGDGNNRTLAQGAVREGQYVAAIYQGHWHRAIIVQVLDSEYIKVRHIDYGTVERVARDSVRMLSREFSTLPAQAARGRLARLKPGWGASRWSLAAARRFLALITQRTLIAYVYAKDEREQIFSLILVDTTTDQDVLLREELVSDGLAEMIPENEPDPDDDVSVSYYVPAFLDLETGRALNFAEKCLMEKMGLCPEYIDVYVNHQPRVEIATKTPKGSQGSLKNESSDTIQYEQTKYDLILDNDETCKPLQFNDTLVFREDSLVSLEIDDDNFELDRTLNNNIEEVSLNKSFKSTMNLNELWTRKPHEKFVDPGRLGSRSIKYAQHEKLVVTCKFEEEEQKENTEVLIDLSCKETNNHYMTKSTPAKESVNIDDSMTLANILKVKQPSHKELLTENNINDTQKLPKPITPLKFDPNVSSSSKSKTENTKIPECYHEAKFPIKSEPMTVPADSRLHKTSQISRHSPPTRPYSNPNCPPSILNNSFSQPLPPPQMCYNPEAYGYRPPPMYAPPPQNFRPRFYPMHYAYPPQMTPYMGHPQMMPPELNQMMPQVPIMPMQFMNRSPLVPTNQQPLTATAARTDESAKVKSSGLSLSAEAREFVPTRKVEMTEFDLELLKKLMEVDPLLAARFIDEKKKENTIESKIEKPEPKPVQRVNPPPGFENFQPVKRNV